MPLIPPLRRFAFKGLAHAPGDAVAPPAPEPAEELVERRRYLRPLPVPQVEELPEEEAWALWAQHS